MMWPIHSLLSPLFYYFTLTWGILAYFLLFSEMSWRMFFRILFSIWMPYVMCGLAQSPTSIYCLLYRAHYSTTEPSFPLLRMRSVHPLLKEFFFSGFLFSFSFSFFIFNFHFHFFIFSFFFNFFFISPPYLPFGGQNFLGVLWLLVCFQLCVRYIFRASFAD